MKRTIIFFLFLFQFTFLSVAIAQTPQITNGLNYLDITQNRDGSWGNSVTSLNTDFYSTAAAVETLRILGQTTSQAYLTAVQWLNNFPVDNAGYLSSRLLALAGSSIDLSGDINQHIQWKNDDSAWGGSSGFLSSNFHTALALQALKAANYSDLSIMNYGLAYLTGAQNTDGGWGFCKAADLGCPDGSNVFMTAIVSRTLQQFPQTSTIATVVSKATAYIIAHQNADGGWGTDTSDGMNPAPTTTSTVYETALAYMALMTTGQGTALPLQNAINYIKATQLPNGSWNDDPYSTALALQALYYSENPPMPPPPAPATGTIMGTVVEAATGKPMSGVSVTLVNNPALTTTTNSSGVFTLWDIPTGAQQVTVKMTGYATLTITTKITTGAFMVKV